MGILDQQILSSVIMPNSFTLNYPTELKDMFEKIRVYG